MKLKQTKGYRRVIAFVVALTTIASIGVASSFTAQSENKKAITNHVDDYTNLLPSLTDTKMKLNDPVFSEKDWYEYIEYEEYSEVVDGDMIYRIYKPTDFAAASVMAIGDYDPSEILGNTTNISMNLGELQGIFDMAQQGSNISKDFAGLNIASGIGANMTNIGDVMDNSKYYSNSSFLGIPGDGKYKGVSNEGFFNADSLDIEIVESETISTCKTMAIDSNYSVAEFASTGKDFSTYSEVGVANSNTIEESQSNSLTNSVGTAIGSAIVGTSETSQSISESITSSLSTEISESLITRVGAKTGWEVGVSASDTNFGATALTNGEVSTELEAGLTASVAAGLETSISSETSLSSSISSESSISNNVESSSSEEHSKLESNSIENSIVNGNGSGRNEENGKEVAVDIGYGVDYQFGNEHSLSVGVTRTFNAREDKEVKNVGWKLCEYIVKVPYYIEAIKVDAAGDETVLYGQYVNYNLLNGVSRVFANGYIEHWYTGELVTYADFFDGFVTASELVDKAKAQQAEKADSFS